MIDDYDVPVEPLYPSKADALFFACGLVVVGYYAVALGIIYGARWLVLGHF